MKLQLSDRQIKTSPPPPHFSWAQPTPQTYSVHLHWCKDPQRGIETTAEGFLHAFLVLNSILGVIEGWKREKFWEWQRGQRWNNPMYEPYAVAL